MSDQCIWKSLITYLKLSHLMPKRVRGTYINPDNNEHLYCYWVELKNKVYTERGIIDIDNWNNINNDCSKEFGNECGLLENEIKQWENSQVLVIINLICNEKNNNNKKILITLLETMWSKTTDN